VSLRKALWLFGLAVALVCLAGGYAMTAYWFVAAAVLAPVGALLFSKKFKAGWVPDLCLFGLVCLAAAGLLLQAPPLLMVLGTTAGLAAWDLENLDRRVGTGEATPSARRFEQRHLLVLAAALGLGLLMAALGRLVAIQIPFVLLLALVIFDLFSLDRVSRYLK
jgi:hypothetical protein